MKIIFKLGILLKIKLWDDQKTVDGQDEFFLEMDADAKLFMKPEGEADPYIASLYYPNKFCTTPQLQTLMKTLQHKKKLL